MKVTRKNFNRITDFARRNFVNQQEHIYWKDKDAEIEFADKRILAMLEAINTELKLGLDIEYYYKEEGN